MTASGGFNGDWKAKAGHGEEEKENLIYSQPNDCGSSSEQTLLNTEDGSTLFNCRIEAVAVFPKAQWGFYSSVINDKMLMCCRVSPVSGGCDVLMLTAFA